jgi:leader peptidase (prepilin peptidase)/N-methyltransferase
VEAATALLYVGVVAAEHDDALRCVLGLAMVTFLVPIAVIDLDLKRIPNALTGPAAVVAVVASALLDPSFLPEQLIAGAAALAFFLIPAVLSKKGMGMGDVKLAGVLGLYLGAAVAPALFIALIVGVVVGVAIVASQGVTRGRKVKVPFGPFMALGAVVAFFAGSGLLDAYTNSF